MIEIRPYSVLADGFFKKTGSWIAMTCGRLLCIAIMSVICSTSVFAGKNVDNSIDIFVKAVVSDSRGFMGEWVRYDVILYSSSKSVVDIKMVSSPGFTDFMIIQCVAESGWSIEKIKGRDYNKAIVASYFIQAKTPGTHTVSPGEYIVSIGKYVVVDDPFWGPSRRMVTDGFKVLSNQVKLRFENIPDGVPADMAIGDFRINSWLTQGGLEPGDDAVVIVSIEGEGDLQDCAIPSLREAFGKGLRLKSVKENRKRFIDREDLCDELVLECIFTADEQGDYIIGSVDFEYFDPLRKKVIRISSDPVDVRIGRSELPSKPKTIYGV